MTWQLIRPDEPLAREITNIERRWQREYGGTVEHNWHEAWLFGYVPLGNPRSSGYALFRRPWEYRTPGGWELYRVWLKPTMRRHGVLSEVWPSWRARYGAFDVLAPSEAMQAFLVRS